ncbi:MAG: hypothetical protein IKB86_00585 [Clostridia bacterium]|nr:hypothetical protein [Clostridia bacterium]
MKVVGTSMMVISGVALGMAAGAYLAMSKPCVRKIYRYGKRAAKQMLNM